MSVLNNGKIAVLAGGPSCEREISLISGRAVHEALTTKGLDVVLIDAVGDFLDQLQREKIHTVFLALHGTFGEDGTIQRLLEEQSIVYTGSGPGASQNAFDKVRSQTLFKQAGVRVPHFVFLNKGEAVLEPEEGWVYPLVVKPSCCGSSVGVSILWKPKGLKQAIETAFHYSDQALVEQYIHGRELTVGILGDSTLPTVEVIAERKFYDYEAKYKDCGTRYESPAKLDEKIAAIVSKQALLAYKALNCQVMGRVDIILGDDGLPYVLEINTIPGLTGKSLLPKAAKAAGIDFPDLCVRILELSLAYRASWVRPSELKKTRAGV